MATNTFKSSTSLAVVTGSGEVTTYTVPADTTAVIIGIQVANMDTSSTTVIVKAAGATLIKNAPIPVAASLSVLDNRIVLETTETITIQCPAAANGVDVIVSYLEIS